MSTEIGYICRSCNLRLPKTNFVQHCLTQCVECANNQYDTWSPYRRTFTLPKTTFKEIDSILCKYLLLAKISTTKIKHRVSHRICVAGCNRLLPLTNNFCISYTSSAGTCFRKWHCKECRRRAKRQLDSLKKKHRHITNEYVGKNCCICLNTMTSKGGRRATLDHDHRRGIRRGVICSSCNCSIGGLGDNVETMQRALHYLKQSEDS